MELGYDNWYDNCQVELVVGKLLVEKLAMASRLAADGTGEEEKKAAAHRHIIYEELLGWLRLGWLKL